MRGSAGVGLWVRGIARARGCPFSARFPLLWGAGPVPRGVLPGSRQGGPAAALAASYLLFVLFCFVFNFLLEYFRV